MCFLIVGVNELTWFPVPVSSQEDNSVEMLKNSRPSSGARPRPGSARERPSSASRARTDSVNSVEVNIN